MKGKFEDPKIQAQVQRMTNWQRNQWANAGYPTHPNSLRKFVKLQRVEKKDALSS